MSKKPPSFNSWDRVWANFLKTKFKTDIFTSFLKSNYETLSSILILQRLPISKLVVMFRCTVASFRYSNTLDGSCHLLFSIFFCRTTNLLHNCSYFYHSSGYAEVNFGHLWRGSLTWHKIITQLPKCLSRGHLEFPNKAESFSPT